MIVSSVIVLTVLGLLGIYGIYCCIRLFQGAPSRGLHINTMHVPPPPKREPKADEGGYVPLGKMIDSCVTDSVYPYIEPFLKELGYGDSNFVWVDIRDALETGIAYKRKYEALQKSEDLKLRKYCFEQLKDLHTDQRIEYGQKLYEYLKTGNLPEKEKEEKE